MARLPNPERGPGPRVLGLLGGALCALLLLPVAAAAAGNPARGADTFDVECGDCHTVTRGGANRKGPNLFGIFGRPSGQVANFRYSDANRNSGFTWDAATLARYIAAPHRVMPGTAMRYDGLNDPAAVQDIIAYLQTLH